MIRRILLAIAALAMFAVGGSQAQTQTTNAMSPAAVDHATTRPAPIIGQVCISVRYVREKIMLGRDGRGIQLLLGGGACEPPGSGISDFSAGFATARGTEDIIEGNSCPEFQTRLNRLWAARQHTKPSGPIPDVRAGPFTITDRSDLFELKSPAGRRAAARSIDQTLLAVRPCWDTIRESYDRKHYVVDLLYDDLRKDVIAAIDAAVTQDERAEYQRLHALSPEAQAALDEERQLRAETSGQHEGFVSANKSNWMIAPGYRLIIFM